MSAALRADPGGAPQMLLPVLAPLVVSWQLHYLPDLARYLERRRPDVIVTGGTYLALVALWARRLAGVGTAVLVTELGNLDHHLFYGSKRRKWRYRFVLPLLRRTLPWADGFVSVSDGVADNLSALSAIPRSRITTIYNPVVTPDLAALARAPVDHPWFAPGLPPVVLGVGRLTDQRDFPTLLRAFVRVIVRTVGVPEHELEVATLVPTSAPQLVTECVDARACLGSGSRVDVAEPGDAGDLAVGPFQRRSRGSYRCGNDRDEGMAAFPRRRRMVTLAVRRLERRQGRSAGESAWAARLFRVQSASADRSEEDFMEGCAV